ncbi:LysM peptidoglycan-binding domain-containing protein [Rufibacter sp. LB8]|uniref:LysM peptidoglycan-binding domain-containing protein n=1 Tax=Rufibacter sp. LB8 TaxID=2777781 RepID=UPI00178C61DE|nr:LysM peptidoglycan-binding domain-containing protein [Rufibacter sp. LB8]
MPILQTQQRGRDSILAGREQQQGFSIPRFPYVSLNLDYNGNLVRSGSHHNLFAANPNYTADIIRDTYQKAGKDFPSIFKHEGDVLFDGKSCYKVVVDYTPYKLYNYKVKSGEDVFSIAKRLFLNEFKIKELNKLDGYTGLKAGQVLVLSNAYARNTILYIDKKSYLPLVQIVYDELGFFERYEYHDVQVNLTFK